MNITLVPLQLTMYTPIGQKSAISQLCAMVSIWKIFKLNPCVHLVLFLVLSSSSFFTKEAFKAALQVMHVLRINHSEKDKKKLGHPYSKSDHLVCLGTDQQLEEDSYTASNQILSTMIFFNRSNSFY